MKTLGHGQMVIVRGDDFLETASRLYSKLRTFLKVVISIEKINGCYNLTVNRLKWQSTNDFNVGLEPTFEQFIELYLVNKKEV